MLRRITLGLVAGLALCGSPPALAVEAPAVARPSFPIDGQMQTRGLVFFVAANTRSGAAAVGTAHTFDLTKLVKAGGGQFVLGNSKKVVAQSRNFLAAPGRPYYATGASLFDDYVVFALDAAPKGVRLLQLEPEPVLPETRVRILGVPEKGPHDEDDLFGRVAEVSPSRIEIDLDVSQDLRGWGGAPVLSQASGKVIGILQAFWPQGSTARVGVSPIAPVRAALTQPLENGVGRPFSSFEKLVAATAAQPPAPAPAGGKTAKGGSAPKGAEGETRHASTTPPGPLIPGQDPGPTRVHVEIDVPSNGSIVGETPCGLYVAGRALALQGELRQFDVIIVLDTSASTADGTGADINGNGVIGKPSLIGGGIGQIFQMGSNDPGDSILAAEVAAARQIVRGLDPRTTRLGVVTFAGEQPGGGGGLFSRGTPPAAITLEPLTNEFARIDRALDFVLSHEPDGNTHMAAGVDQATIELLGLRGAQSKPNPKSEKLVLFFTDGQPTLPYGPGFDADNVRAVLRAASRAARAHVRIHSFAIGPEALDGPVATVEMASRTDGYFTPVRHPGDLVEVVEDVSFANLDKVALRSLTRKEDAAYFRTTADGSWGGLVKLQPGTNVIEVLAHATDGTASSRTVEVSMKPGEPTPPVPEELAAQRNWLLEECLRDVKKVRMTAEQERAEQVRKDLMVEIEKERAAARKRSDDQRKRLELGVEDPDAPETPPKQ
ncbi:MAG TPA: vWA domain-containing protein [Myxococcota bacterium]|nr:vWA domain-containing protein [Myxococcota bacterium]